MVASNVGSMPGPAPPQFPGHSLSQLQPGELGTRISGGPPMAASTGMVTCPFSGQNRPWATLAQGWGQRGTEACAPQDPGSSRATILARSAWPCSLWEGRTERAGRSMEWYAELWMGRRSPWFLVFSAASLLCSLLTVPASPGWPSSFVSLGHFWRASRSKVGWSMIPGG